MKHFYTGICKLTLDHVPGAKTSTHVDTKVRLEVSGNLNPREYLDKGLPTQGGIKPLTLCFVHGLVANMIQCQKHGWWPLKEHLAYVMKEINRCLAIDEVRVGESTMEEGEDMPKPDNVNDEIPQSVDRLWANYIRLLKIEETDLPKRRVFNMKRDFFGGVALGLIFAQQTMELGEAGPDLRRDFVMQAMERLNPPDPDNLSSMNVDEQHMLRAGRLLEDEMPGLGWILLTYTFGDADKSLGNYISNGSREDCIKYLRETADKLEAGTTFATPNNN
ncbi:MAG: hypothetical protein WKF87_22560 [Chryseolinea sp.]